MKFPWEREAEANKNPKTDEEDDIELKAKDVKEKLDSIDSLKTEFTTYKSKLDKLDDISAYIAEQRRKEAEAAAAKKKELSSQKEDEEEENLDFVGDPLNATKTLINKGVSKAIYPLLTMTVNTQARQLAKEHFLENPKFELYTDPSFRSEVDKLILSLPLNSQLDPKSLENCYAVVAFQKQQEIKEGKIKARFNAVAGAASGTGAESQTNKELILTPDQKKAAAMFGMSEKEYGERFQKEHSIV